MYPPFLLNLHQIQGHGQPHIYRKSKDNNLITISSFPPCYCCRTKGVLPFFEKKVPVHTHCFLGVSRNGFPQDLGSTHGWKCNSYVELLLFPDVVDGVFLHGLFWFGFRGDGGGFVLDLRYCASVCRQGIDNIPTSVSLTLSVRASSF